MPRPPRPPGEAFTESILVRMTPMQKAKLDLLGKGQQGGAAGLVRGWIDTLTVGGKPLPSATPGPAPARATRTPRAPAPTSSIDEPTGAQLSLTPARFVELDP